MKSNTHTISLLFCLSLEILLIARFLALFGTGHRVLPTSWHLGTLALTGITILLLVGPLRRGSVTHRIAAWLLGLLPGLLLLSYGYIGIIGLIQK